MPINDIISGLLEKIGLKKGEVALARDAIARLEEELRCANDDLSAQDEELQGVERQLRAAKAQYDAATGVMKRSREAVVRSLMKKLELIQERQQITLAHRDSTQALLHQSRLDLDKLLHPVATEQLEEAGDRKRELLEELQERDLAQGELEKQTYQPGATNDESRTTPVSDAEADARLQQDFARLMGEEPAKPASDTAEAEEKPQELA